jgi:hypothetical protein
MGRRDGVGGYLILWVWGLWERDEWWWEAGRNCLLGRYSTKPVVVRGAAGW